MLKGRITNINSTKYMVDVDDVLYNCRLRGIFRKDKITPLVGDYVEINEKDLQITKIFPRFNYLKRPNIANIDVALIMVSVKKPDLDLVLLDKLLVMIKKANVKPIIENTELDILKKKLSQKVIVLCGQTGSGKSSLINKLDSSLKLATNPISESLNRGVHTTRYVSLYKIDDFYLADTPGFSALDLNELSKEDLINGFIEFKNYQCQYQDCDHMHTEGCMIKNNSKILASRYNNYIRLIKEYYENSRKFFKK